MAKDMKSIARLARAEGQALDGVMSATIEGGQMAIQVAQRPGDVAALLQQNALEQKAGQPSPYSEEMSEDELDERSEALEQLIKSKMAWERRQIAQTIFDYASDCQKRSDELALQGHRARKEFRQDDLPELAEKALEDCKQRAKAFAIRAAIAVDLAKKIDQGWSRNPDGTPQ